jgi:Protein of unknown function (DUF4232)
MKPVYLRWGTQRLLALLQTPTARNRPRAARTAAAATCAAAACLLAGCGLSTTTVTVTVTATPAPPVPVASPGTVSPSPAATTSAPASPPGCATSALKASLGRGGAAAGSTYYPIEFTNTSGFACTMYGYPGASFVTASGAQVGAAAKEDPVYPRRLVTLAAGATAHAELQVTVAQNYPASACSPVAVHRLKVYPPGQTSALYIGLTSTGCAKSSVDILAVQTVQPGSG